MRVSEATERLYQLFDTPKLKCVHKGNWERNESVYICSQGDWDSEIKRLVEIANASNDLNYLDCFQASSDHLDKNETCDCITGLSYDDNGDILNKSEYTLYGRTIDYDGIKETSGSITPKNQVGWCRLYGSRICYYQFDKMSFWKSECERNQYSLRVCVDKMVDGKPSIEFIIVVVKDI